MPGDSTYLSIDESARRRFEAAWQAGPAPLAEYLPSPDDPLYLPTLEELVHIEIEMRWRQRLSGGSTVIMPSDLPRVEDYLERFPQLNQPNIVLRLVKQEARVRRLHGDPPVADEYRRRFPLIDTDELDLGVTPPVAPKLDNDLPDIPGYAVLQILGRGGMGVVYKARQLGLNRLVAIKMIRAGLDASADDLSRFRREGEAAAQLQHPNIAQVFEVGQYRGLPYFTLEFVSGGGLDRYLGGQPRPPRVAAHFVQTLAQAMHFAHGRGIVHRDLKPANILMVSAATKEQTTVVPEQRTAGPAASTVAEHDNILSSDDALSLVPKIADFGLAKRLQSDASQTHTGAILGTPSYMAPEQAAGKKDVGPAADIYALGAILYEMLTGKPPFRGPTAWDTIYLVLNEEPVPPARLQPKVPRDLDTICLKCLEKDAARRYATAQALAEDLGRFLRDEPIQVRPVGQAERLWRWSRRNPRVAVLAASFLFVLVAGLVSVTALWLLADGRRDDAEKANSQAQKDRIAAQTATKQAEKDRDAADDAKKRAQKDRDAADIANRQAQKDRDAADIANKIAQKERDAADETARKARAAIRENVILATDHEEFRKDGMQEARKLLLDKALQYFLDFAEQRKDDLALREDVADALTRAGNILEDRGDAAGARTNFDKARILWEDLLTRRPEDVELQLRYAGVLGSLGYLHNRAGQHKEAVNLQQKAIDLRERIAKAHPSDSEHQHGLAVAWRKRASGLYDAGDLKEALKTYRRAQDLLEELHRKLPTNELVQESLAACLIGLGHALKDLGKSADAIPAYKRSAELYGPLLSHPYPEYRRALAIAHASHASAASDLGQTKDALEAYRLALGQRDDLVRNNPLIPDYRADRGTVSLNYADEISSMSDPKRKSEVLDLRLKAVKDFADAAAQSPANVTFQDRLAFGHMHVSRSYRQDLKQFDKAEERLRLAVGIWEKLLESKKATPEHRYHLALTHAEVAMLHINKNAPAAAIGDLTKANDLLERLLNTSFDGPRCLQELSRNYANLAYCHSVTGNIDKAIPIQIKVIDWRRDLVAKHPEVPYYAKQLQSARDNMAELVKSYVNAKAPPAKSDKPDAQLAHERKRRPVWSKLTADYPKFADFRLGAVRCDIQIADLENQLGRGPQALAAYEAARASCKDMIRDGLAVAPCRQALADTLGGMQALKAHWPADPAWLYDMAADLARCAAEPPRTKAPADPREAARRRGFADDCVRVLRLARDRGFTNWAAVEHDDAFAALRLHVEFQGLLNEIKK